MKPCQLQRMKNEEMVEDLRFSQQWRFKLRSSGLIPCSVVVGYLYFRRPYCLCLEGELLLSDCPFSGSPQLPTGCQTLASSYTPCLYLMPFMQDHSLQLEDRGNIDLQNVGIPLQHYAPQPW